MKKIDKSKKSNETQHDHIGIEHNKYTLDLVNSWIVAADNKISIAFAIFSVIFGVFNWLSLKDIGGLYTNNRIAFIVTVAILGASTVCFAVSMIIFASILRPNHFSSQKKKEYSIFYEEIATFDDAISYQKVCEQATEEYFSKELVHEIFYNSQVCSRKMRLFKRALTFSIVSLALGLVAFALSTIASQIFIASGSQEAAQISSNIVFSL